MMMMLSIRLCLILSDSVDQLSLRIIHSCMASLCYALVGIGFESSFFQTLLHFLKNSPKFQLPLFTSGHSLNKKDATFLSLS